MTRRRILVTSALPYANGPIHVGHLVEYIQTDIWVRFQRARGNECVYFCADDTHGTAIMMRARQEGSTEEALIAKVSEAHQADFRAFDIQFDHYGSTHSAENRALCAEVWEALRRANLVVERDVTQLFDNQEGVFLADRFVRGTCPNCQAPNQYGDSCDQCSTTYAATDLIDPRSTLSGTAPEVRTARHLFVQIEALHEFLDEWTQDPEHLQAGVANYLKGHFLSKPLKDWDVSRPAPYFGFEIPDSPGNYWYVWFDAPIGYMATTRAWCAAHGKNFDDYWRSSEVEIHHFIGKDITYFHTLFWPSMLKAAGFSLPRRVQVHGFLTVNGEKMSKSKGTFIMASTYLEYLDPAYLRYYYASKLTSKVDDLDLDQEEFANKVNSDLVGKVVNLASRSVRFVKDTGLSASYPEDGGLFEAAARTGAEIAEAYEICDYSRAMRLVMKLADSANEYVDQKQPWVLKKEPQRARELQDVCTVVINLYRQIVIYLAPVLPRLADQSSELLGDDLARWVAAETPLVGVRPREFKHLMQRVDPKKLQAIIDASVSAPAQADAEAKPAEAEDGAGPLLAEPLAPECSIVDLDKVDLRIARIVAAEAVPKAKKLLKLTVSLGGDHTRSVFAGIRAAYEPSALVGRLVVIVANLKPRQMSFGVSEAMVLAAGSGGGDLFVLSPDTGAKPGQRVH